MVEYKYHARKTILFLDSHWIYITELFESQLYLRCSVTDGDKSDQRK